MDAPPRSNSVNNSEPLTYDSGMNSISPNSQSVSGSHLSASSQTHQRLNGDSGIGTSPPPPVNLKTHPSLRRRHERTSSQGSGIHVQRSLSIDTTETSRTSQLSHEDDLQFSCGRETPNSEHSDPLEQQSEAFRARAQQVPHGKEAYEYMRHPTKPRTESAPPAPVGSNYVHMNPSEEGKQRSKENRSSLPPSTTTTSNYVNHVIPADMKAPSENYENIGFNAMRTPPLMPKGDNLATINEGAALQQKVYEPPSALSNYVNSEIKPASSSELYQNVTPPLTSQLSQEYENVSLKISSSSSSPRLSTHENVTLKKIERKNSIRDRSGSLQYSEIENNGSHSPSPTNKFNRQYSDVDYHATLAVETQQRDRTLQKEQRAAQQTKVH